MEFFSPLLCEKNLFNHGIHQTERNRAIQKSRCDY